MTPPGCQNGEGAEAIRREDEWHVMSARADQDTGDESEDMAAIGHRDGYSEAVQTLDVLTGGDGEYRYCTVASASHCPDPPAMIRRILSRQSLTAHEPATADVGLVHDAIVKRADECRSHAEASFYPRACSEYRAKETAFREAATLVAALSRAAPSSERTDEQEAAKPRCGCKPEIARRVIIDHGTCGMGGCPYGGDF